MLVFRGVKPLVVGQISYATKRPRGITRNVFFFFYEGNSTSKCPKDSGLGINVAQIGGWEGLV